MHLVGFVIRIYHDARSPERQMELSISICISVRSSRPIKALDFHTHTHTHTNQMNFSSYLKAAETGNIHEQSHIYGVIVHWKYKHMNFFGPALFNDDFTTRIIHSVEER